jgi:hypothetical protein
VEREAALSTVALAELVDRDTLGTAVEALHMPRQAASGAGA